MLRRAAAATALLLVVVVTAPVAGQQWPFETTDLTARDALTMLVFGDGGTGDAGQCRVGHAMASTCVQRGCDLALMVGDNIYENGIEVKQRDDVELSLQEVLHQFDLKFEQPYAAFARLPGFHFWVALGNHDYRRNVAGAMVTYSEFSALWRLPALHYEIPRLPAWIQIHAVHTDTDVRRDLNGLQVASIRRRLCEPEPADRWRLLFGHQPVYNSGHHRNDGRERRTRALLEQSLLRDCGVHLYFAGPAHHQEHLTARGFEQVIQGAAARSKGSNRPRPSSTLRQRFFSRTFGLAIVDVDAERLRLDFYDVLNTEERRGSSAAPSPDEVVLSYSRCGTRDDIGKPNDAPPACP